MSEVAPNIREANKRESVTGSSKGFRLGVVYSFEHGSRGGPNDLLTFECLPPFLERSLGKGFVQLLDEFPGVFEARLWILETCVFDKIESADCLCEGRPIDRGIDHDEQYPAIV